MNQSFLSSKIQSLVPSSIGVQPLEEIAEENSYFSCEPRKVRGFISQQLVREVEENFSVFIEIAREAGLSPIVDVRVQRLMPGMFPSIPGWHCDAVPRDSYFGQPCFDKINEKAFHVVCNISTQVAGVSQTEFFNEERLFTIEDPQKVYQDLHNQVEEVIDSQNSFLLPDSHLALFDPKTVHRATATKTRGWRMFFRYSMYPNPPIQNKKQNVEQVYILTTSNGW